MAGKFPKESTGKASFACERWKLSNWRTGEVRVVVYTRRRFGCSIDYQDDTHTVERRKTTEKILMIRFRKQQLLSPFQRLSLLLSWRNVISSLRGQISYQSPKSCARSWRIRGWFYDTHSAIVEKFSKEITNHKYLHIISHFASARSVLVEGIKVRRGRRNDEN